MTCPTTPRSCCGGGPPHPRESEASAVLPPADRILHRNFRPRASCPGARPPSPPRRTPGPPPPGRRRPPAFCPRSPRPPRGHARPASSRACVGSINGNCSVRALWRTPLSAVSDLQQPLCCLRSQAAPLESICLPLHCGGPTEPQGPIRIARISAGSPRAPIGRSLHAGGFGWGALWSQAGILRCTLVAASPVG